MYFFAKSKRQRKLSWYKMANHRIKLSEEKQGSPGQRIHAHRRSVSVEIASTAKPRAESVLNLPCASSGQDLFLHMEVICYSITEELFHLTWTFYSVNHIDFYSFILVIHLPRPAAKAAFEEFSFWWENHLSASFVQIGIFMQTLVIFSNFTVWYDLITSFQACYLVWENLYWRDVKNTSFYSVVSEGQPVTLNQWHAIQF